MDKVLVLDTETTGLDRHAEILQFSAIWGSGEIAINQYICPDHTSSWPRAMAVNHITPTMVMNEPAISELKDEIEDLLYSADIIVGYNLPFDLQMLKQNGIDLPPEDKVKYVDLMIPFAEVYGEYNDYYGDYKWQKLITCAHYYGYTGDGWHDSLADVRATLYCYRKMLDRGDL